MLNAFDRDDMVKLWGLVKERFNSTDPTNDKDRELWVELKILFEPNEDDVLWKFNSGNQGLTWTLYNSCAVHHFSTKAGTDIYMLVEREYPLSKGTLTLMLDAKLDVDEYTDMARNQLKKIFM